MNLIGTIKSDLLKSPELTGQWEHKLRLIEKGNYDPQTFKIELFKMVRELSDEVIFN
jgi:DNA topoisomerase-3